MSDTARKVFPTETVLALIVGNKDIDLKELVGYIAGRSITCCCAVGLISPLASGWLANLYPAFFNLDWNKDTPWADFVAKSKADLGDNISLPPMPAAKLATVNSVIDRFIDFDSTNKALSAELTNLQAQVEELLPFKAKAQEFEKKADQLDAKVKSVTADANALRKEVIPFRGKMAVDQQELETMIKTAITSNLKGFVLGGAVAGAAVAGAADETTAAPEAVADNGPAADFGFGASGASSDGFGF